MCYHYSSDRRGVHPQTHLKAFAGILHADGYAGFKGLYRPDTSGIAEAACWAHVRRKFFDLTVAGPAPVAEEALRPPPARKECHGAGHPLCALALNGARPLS